jgi:hypothetical protein
MTKSAEIPSGKNAFLEIKKSNGSVVTTRKIAKKNAFLILTFPDAMTRCDVVDVFASISLSAISFKMQPTDLAKNDAVKNRKKLLNVSDFEKTNPKKHGMKSKIVPIWF